MATVAAPGAAASPVNPGDLTDPLCPEPSPDDVAWVCVDVTWTQVATNVDARAPGEDSTRVCVQGVCVELPHLDAYTITTVTLWRASADVDYDVNLGPVVEYVCELIDPGAAAFADHPCRYVEAIYWASLTADGPVDGVYFEMAEGDAYYLPLAAA